MEQPVHPVALALARNGGVLTRPSPPVPRGHCGHWLKGHSGNPGGRPGGRPKMRQAFHQFGLAAVAKLAALADDPALSAGERSVVLAECIRLSYSVRAIRSDAAAAKKAEHARQQAEMDRRMGLLARRVEMEIEVREAAAVLKNAGLPRATGPVASEAEPPWLC